jgi:hypothetical protein
MRFSDGAKRRAFSTAPHPTPVTDNLDREYRERIVELCAEKLLIPTARGPSTEPMQHMKNIA